MPGAIEAQNPHGRRIVDPDGQRSHGDVGLPVDVILDELGVVHPVQVIAREDEVVVRVVALEVAHCLPHGVRRALIPVRIVGSLLGRQDFHEAAAERIEPVSLADVPVERGRVELREDEDPPDLGVQAVADGDVDQAVLAADRHRRFRTAFGEREEPGTLTAAQDDRENVAHAAFSLLEGSGLQASGSGTRPKSSLKPPKCEVWSPKP